MKHLVITNKQKIILEKIYKLYIKDLSKKTRYNPRRKNNFSN